MDIRKMAILQSDRLTIDPSLRLYIPFNEGIGDVAKDYSQYSNNGVLTDVKWDIQGGVFNGTSAYADCGNDSSLDITDAITVDVWANPEESGDYGRYVAKGGTYLLGQEGVDETDLRWELNGLSPTVLNSGTGKVTVGVWNNIVGTYDKNAGSGNRKIFINGIEINSDTQTGAISSSMQSVYLGILSEVAQCFSGSMDEVRIYSRALAASEIKIAYENERGKYEV